MERQAEILTTVMVLVVTAIIVIPTMQMVIIPMEAALIVTQIIVQRKGKRINNCLKERLMTERIEIPSAYI